MAEPFIGELRLFPIGFAPKGWADCNGQLLPINQNQALYSILGTTYGGNGQTNFALPDLRGRVPIHSGSGYPLGMSAGEEAHTLSANEMPMHTHQVYASTATASSPDPQGQVWANVISPYGPAESVTNMNANAIGNAGGSQAHNNMQPYLSLRFCIATAGIYPSRS